MGTLGAGQQTAQLGQERDRAPVAGVDMQPDALRRAEFDDLGDPVDRARPRRARGGHHRQGRLAVAAVAANRLREEVEPSSPRPTAGSEMLSSAPSPATKADRATEK